MYAKLRGVKQVSSLLTRDASDYVAGFSQRVIPSAPTAIYSPAWESGYSPFDTVSYAIYRFDLTARTGKLGINTEWTQGMADKKLLWLGASNWQKDRWDWRNGDPAGVVDTGTEGMGLYKHPDTSEMYVAVVVLGQTSGLLRKVWLTCSLRGDWWMDGRNATHHACSPFIGPDQPSLLWSRQITKSMNASQPVYDANGVIYVRLFEYLDSDVLFALGPGGEEKWRTQLPDVGGNVSAGAGMSNTPAIGDDGTLYCAAARGPLYAVNQDGDIQWSFAGHLYVIGSPAIGPSGVIYVTGVQVVVDHSEYYLHALNPDGAPRWEYAFGEGNEASSPAVSADGMVYICMDNEMYAITPDGALAWSYAATGGARLGSPSIGAGGQVYASSNESKLYVLSATGELAGAFSIAPGLYGQLALDALGSVYGGGGDGAIAIGADGSMRWTYYTAGGAKSVLDAAGNVYVASGDSRLYALAPDGALRWWFVASDQFNSAPCIGEDGTLYAVVNEGMMYAFGPGSQVPEHAISGYVKDGLGQGLAGVVVTVTGEEPVMTDAQGYWSKDGLADGAYLVAATQVGNQFSPLFYEVVVAGADAAVADFTAAASTAPPWPMYGLDRAHTRRSPYSGPETPALLWQTDLPAQNITDEPVLGGDGTVYVQGDTGSLSAINPDGTLRWSQALGFKSIGSPAVAADGTVFTAHDNSVLSAFTPGGVFKWAYSNWPSNSPVLMADNTVLLYDDRHLSKLRYDGTLEKAFTYTLPPNNQAVPVAPGIAADGTIYIAAENLIQTETGSLLALNSDGSMKWLISPLDNGVAIPSASPAIGDDGTVYLGFGKYFYAISPAGAQLWSYYTSDANGDGARAPAIASDGTLYFFKGDINNLPSNKLIALNPDGSLKWEYYADGYGFRGSPTVDANGVVYASIRGLGEMRALNPDGTLKWSYDTPADTTPAVLGADGTVYFADSIGKVYALGPGTV